MKKRPLISVVTINFNQSEMTNQLLESFKNVTWPSYELIIVDNNSQNNDADHINTNYPNLRVIRNEKNLGFAGGNNLGIKAAKGEYILFLNNDTEVDPGFLEPMIERFESFRDTGAVSPKIRFFHHPEKIQYAGFSKMSPFTLRMNGFGYGETDKGQYDQGKETEFAHGCAMMVSRKVIEEVGLMPEEYFLYYEEHDWSTTIKKHGYKIFYEPKSLILHKESMSVEKNSILKTYFINRNRVLYMRRNFNWFYRIISATYILLISVPKNTAKYLIASETSHLKAYWDAILWNLTHKTKPQWKF
ncbi:MAG: glycosyltransferase family 2 protein [Bacteroidales bacterium]|nr:glycosyltransferase family 2 protein [Bacteroidales bacterium]MCF8391519.1 glycosyltransferase family 2 protein [Bacteroidales bacterium]